MKEKKHGANKIFTEKKILQQKRDNYNVKH